MRRQDRMSVASSFPWALYGLTVVQVLRDPGCIGCTRSGSSSKLYCLELFSGVGSIWRAAARSGYPAAGYDSNDTSDQDITTRVGFFRALSLTLSLVPGALLWLAPECSTFCYLAQVIAQRTAYNQWEGNVTNPLVAKANAMVRAAMFLMNLAWARGVRCVLENPLGSRIWAMLRAARAVCFPEWIAGVMRCAYSEEPVGDRLWKRYRLLCTEP